MPDGQTHHYYWRVLWIPTLSVSTVLLVGSALWMAKHDRLYQASFVLEFWFWFNFWYLAGRYCDPDWDLAGVNAAEGRITRELDLLGVLLFGISSFYAAFMNYLAAKFRIKGLFGSHRSWLTHSPVGTTIRVLFINAPLVYLYQFAQAGFAGFGIIFQLTSPDIVVFLLAQLFGLGWADSIHVYLDYNY